MFETGEWLFDLRTGAIGQVDYASDYACTIRKPDRSLSVGVFKDFRRATDEEILSAMFQNDYERGKTEGYNEGYRDGEKAGRTHCKCDFRRAYIEALDDVMREIQFLRNAF